VAADPGDIRPKRKPNTFNSTDRAAVSKTMREAGVGSGTGRPRRPLATVGPAWTAGHRGPASRHAIRVPSQFAGPEGFFNYGRDDARCADGRAGAWSLAVRSRPPASAYRRACAVTGAAIFPHRTVPHGAVARRARDHGSNPLCSTAIAPPTNSPSATRAQRISGLAKARGPEAYAGQPATTPKPSRCSVSPLRTPISATRSTAASPDQHDHRILVMITCATSATWSSDTHDVTTIFMS
jgi:hypothetical protein